MKAINKAVGDIANRVEEEFTYEYIEDDYADTEEVTLDLDLFKAAA